MLFPFTNTLAKGADLDDITARRWAENKNGNCGFDTLFVSHPVPPLRSWYHVALGTRLESAKPETCYLARDWTCALSKQWDSAFLSSVPWYSKEHCFAWRLPGFARLSFWHGTEMKMNMGHWLNDTGMGKFVCSERNLSQCHFAYHVSHKARSEDEPGTSRYGTAVEAWSLSKE
jgi:hypothetical protein